MNEEQVKQVKEYIHGFVRDLRHEVFRYSRPAKGLAKAAKQRMNELAFNDAELEADLDTIHNLLNNLEEMLSEALEANIQQDES